MGDLTQSLVERVSDAMRGKRALNIVGGNSKTFYGQAARGEALEVASHRGILNYAPTELVATVRAGTPLSELEQVLAENQQRLPFEPPHFGESATVGGTVACNFSGPRRPYAGAVRDHVLGVRIINGKGEVLSFGGEVMKNVAGYDISRLMSGALGTLGVLLEVSFKVIPMAEHEITLYRSCTIDTAIDTMNQWAGRPYPISAAAFDGENLYMRFSGSHSAVEASRLKFGGETMDDGVAFWQRLKEHQHGFFQGEGPLWRLSLPPAAAPLKLAGKQLIDWGGAQRWYRGDAEASTIRRLTREAGGHAVLFRGGDRSLAFPPLDPVLLRLHEKLKQAMDPEGILNPGRLYAEL
ncbi:MAG: glycolate oxidase subunit GlcE [Gammaproteobacteria bacterium]|nr:glycolate oxidase subunit GlcE [Gammaproteobacteria bacterium]